MHLESMQSEVSFTVLLIPSFHNSHFEQDLPKGYAPNSFCTVLMSTAFSRAPSTPPDTNKRINQSPKSHLKLKKLILA